MTIHWRTLLGPLLAVTLVSGVMVGCSGGNGPDEADGSPVWKAMSDSDKLTKIKAMPLSPDQKIQAINKLNVPQADKDAAAAEIRSGGGAPATTGTPPTGGTPSNGG